MEASHKLAARHRLAPYRRKGRDARIRQQKPSVGARRSVRTVLRRWRA